MALFKRKAPVIPGSRDPKKGWRDQKHAPEGAHDESNWLVSYADMMTLLCGFFILLFSMSKMDEPKYEKTKEEVSKHFGGKYEAPPTNELAEFFRTAVRDMGIADKTMIKSDPLSVTVSFQSTMFFDTLSAEVKPEGQALLQRMIAGISEKQLAAGKRYKVAVEGHTDSRPVLGGPYPSNWELAGARSAHVARMFIEKGFDPAQLTSISYADTRPDVEPRNAYGKLDETALAKNRRVVLRIMDPRVEAIPMPEPPVAAAPAAPVAALASPPVAALASPPVAALASPPVAAAIAPSPQSLVQAATALAASKPPVEAPTLAAPDAGPKPASAAQLTIPAAPAAPAH